MCCLVWSWPGFPVQWLLPSVWKKCFYGIWLWQCSSVVPSFRIVKKSEFCLEDSEGWEAINLVCLHLSSTPASSQRALSLLLCSVSWEPLTSPQVPGSPQPPTPVFISSLPHPHPTDDPLGFLQQLRVCPFLHTLSSKWLDFAVLPFIPVTVLGPGGVRTDRQAEWEDCGVPLGCWPSLAAPWQREGVLGRKEGTVLCVLVQVSQTKDPTQFWYLWTEMFLSLVTTFYLVL